MLDEILKTFRLEGEDVIRIRTGKVVKEQDAPYTMVTLWNPIERRRRTLKYHRIKFALIHGYLPVEVDHEDKNSRNNLGANLRDVSGEIQKHNREYLGARLPRGVVRMPHGRFTARPYVSGRSLYRGIFDTPAEASAAVEQVLQAHYGELYSPRKEDPDGSLSFERTG